jgi:hypothetical protein
MKMTEEQRELLYDTVSGSNINKIKALMDGSIIPYHYTFLCPEHAGEPEDISYPCRLKDLRLYSERARIDIFSYDLRKLSEQKQISGSTPEQKPEQKQKPEKPEMSKYNPTMVYKAIKENERKQFKESKMKEKITNYLLDIFDEHIALLQFPIKINLEIMEIHLDLSLDDNLIVKILEQLVEKWNSEPNDLCYYSLSEDDLGVYVVDIKLKTTPENLC